VVLILLFKEAEVIAWSFGAIKLAISVLLLLLLALPNPVNSIVVVDGLMFADAGEEGGSLSKLKCVKLGIIEGVFIFDARDFIEPSCGDDVLIDGIKTDVFEFANELLPKVLLIIVFRLLLAAIFN
jgi:hypothetical protein